MLISEKTGHFEGLRSLFIYRFPAAVVVDEALKDDANNSHRFPALP